MYAKCGSVDVGFSVFHSIKNDVVAWTALIVVFALHGRTEIALAFVDHMLFGLKPEVTFLGVLNACSYAGLVTEGQRHFNAMKMNME